MTTIVDIKAGQWVLAFDQPFSPYTREMPEHLEMFAHRGGGWESCRATEIFTIRQVEKVTPKSCMVIDPESLRKKYWVQLPKTSVIKAFESEADAAVFRDELYKIGVEASDLIEAEMYRRIEKFADREHAKAIKRIRRLLPQHFGRDA